MLPLRQDVGQIQRMDEVAVGLAPRMRDQAHLSEPRLHVPVLGFDGNLMLQQSPRLRPAVEALLSLPLVVLQSSINLPSTDLQDLRLDLRREAMPVA